MFISDENIDKESLLLLDDQDINENLIPKLGPRVKFKRKLKLLKVTCTTLDLIYFTYLDKYCYR